MKFGPLFGICDLHKTPEELLKNIRQFEEEGAHGVVLNFDQLNREYWNIETFRMILSACRRVESYACFYRNDRTQDLTDEERADFLLMAAEAGADIVDVMGDLFDRQSDELTYSPSAIEKQKKLICELKKRGAQVLMSSHVMKFRPYPEALKYFYAHAERSCNFSKVVFSCDTEEELAVAAAVNQELCRSLSIPFVHVCGGEMGKKVQRYETLLTGSAMTFVRCHSGSVQPSVKEALEFLRKRTPWAVEGARRELGEFNGKTAVITGAASGMGLLAARKLAEKGASILLLDINEEAVRQAASSIRDSGGDAIGSAVDVRSFADAEKAASLALEKFGRIDFLLTFAGGYEPRCCNSSYPFYQQPIEVIDWGMDVNLKGAVYFARACMPAMIRQRSGVIVTLGSVSGEEGNASGPMYGTSKRGLTQFVRGLALAGAPHNVRALCVAPGPVLTRPGMAAMQTPLGRAADPIEVVDFILTLCSDKSSFITGSTHFIDGGYLSR